MIMLLDVPVFPLLSVAVMVIVSALASLVLMVNGLLESVLVLSPKVPFASLSNCTLPVPVMVT